MNHANDSRWMSIRLGRSRTCLRRENDLRARGAVTVWAKENSLPYVLWDEDGRKRLGTCGNGAWAYVGQPLRIAEALHALQAAARSPSTPEERTVHLPDRVPP